jgi:hypothetical protein
LPGLLEIKISVQESDLERQLAPQVVEDADVQRERLASLHRVWQVDVSEEFLPNMDVLLKTNMVSFTEMIQRKMKKLPMMASSYQLSRSLLD